MTVARRPACQGELRPGVSNSALHGEANETRTADPYDPPGAKRCRRAHCGGIRRCWPCPAVDRRADIRRGIEHGHRILGGELCDPDVGCHWPTPGLAPDSPRSLATDRHRRRDCAARRRSARPPSTEHIHDHRTRDDGRHPPDHCPRVIPLTASPPAWQWHQATLSGIRPGSPPPAFHHVEGPTVRWPRLLVLQP